ncbi:MAG: hypothetical protein R3Y64_06895 [Peptostreptococcaceae bacterium]
MENNIIEVYDKINAKKIFKKSIKEISTKRIFLLYSNIFNLPICALILTNTVMASRTSVINFCYQINELYDIKLSEENIKSIIKFIVGHETGHILDSSLKKTRSEYQSMILTFRELCIEYKKNNTSIKTYQLEDLGRQIKNNLIEREITAWNIASEIIDFKDDNEIYIFNKTKEYALATYNTISYKSLYRQMEYVI